jgi:hypothetical protein
MECKNECGVCGRYKGCSGYQKIMYLVSQLMTDGHEYIHKDLLYDVQLQIYVTHGDQLYLKLRPMDGLYYYVEVVR